MSRPVLRVRSLFFPRGSVADGLGSIPVRASRLAPVPVVDWFRGDGVLSSGALAFPTGLGRQDTLPLRAEFEVLESFAAPLFLRSVPRGSNLLGRVFSIAVGPATQGATVAMDLALDGHELEGAAVGQHELVWTWQHSRDKLDWRDFDETAHTVFTLLDHPAPPWGGPSDPRTVVPWLETMKTACGWAKGVRKTKTAMDRITKRVDALGGTPIGQHTLDYVGSASVTLDEIFDISAFMKAVNGEPDATHSMSCMDLASAVAMFAAQLGCRSSSLQLLPKKKAHSATFRTNPIRLFGELGQSIEDFSRHEVVRLDKEEVVWDACLAVDFDDEPEKEPGKFSLATGLALSGVKEPSGIGYIARLVVPLHQDCRRVVPFVDGIRYPDELPPGVRRKRDPAEDARRRGFLKEMQGTPWSEPTAAALDGSFEAWLESVALDHAFGRSVSSGRQTFRFIPIRLQDADGAARAEISVLRPPVLRRPSPRRSVDIFLALLASYAHALRRIPSLGDFAMYGKRDDMVFMFRGGVIAVVHGDRARGAAAITTARSLDSVLSRYFASPRKARRPGSPSVLRAALEDRPARGRRARPRGAPALPADRARRNTRGRRTRGPVRRS